MKTHPELNRGEYFLGNREGDQIPDDLRGIKGLRIASPAYDIEGKTLPGYSALIATAPAAAAYNRLKEAQLSAIRRS